MKKFGEIVGILAEGLNKALRDSEYLFALLCCTGAVLFVTLVPRLLWHEEAKVYPVPMVFYINQAMAKKSFVGDTTLQKKISEETKIEENLRCAEDYLRKGHPRIAESCLNLAKTAFKEIKAPESAEYQQAFKKVSEAIYKEHLSAAREHFAGKEFDKVFTDLYLARWRAELAGFINPPQLLTLEKEYNEKIQKK